MIFKLFLDIRFVHIVTVTYLKILMVGAQLGADGRASAPVGPSVTTLVIATCFHMYLYDFTFL